LAIQWRFSFVKQLHINGRKLSDLGRVLPIRLTQAKKKSEFYLNNSCSTYILFNFQYHTPKKQPKSKYKLRQTYKRMQIIHIVGFALLEYTILPVLFLVSVGSILGVYIIVKLHMTTSIHVLIFGIGCLVLLLWMGYVSSDHFNKLTEFSLTFRATCLSTPGLTKYYRLAFETCYPIIIRIKYFGTISKHSFLTFITGVIIDNAITCLLTF